jgi:hypothetical protein
MTLQDLIDKGTILANEIGDILKLAFDKLHDKDIEIIGIYVLILVIGGLLIFGIRLLVDEIEEYRGSREDESGNLPWYLRDSSLFLAIVVLILVVFAVIFVLIL